MTFKIANSRFKEHRSSSQAGKHPKRRSVSDGVALQTFHILCKHLSVFLLKSLAIGLPLSRTDTKRDGSCPSVSDGVDPPTFYTLFKHFNVFLLVSRDRTSAQSNRHKKRRVVSDGVDPPTFYTLCKHLSDLAIGLPVSRTVAYPRRSDSVRVYWTCMVIMEMQDLRRDGSENVAQNCKFKFVNLFRHYLSMCNF